MKKSLLFIHVLISSISFSQVGINTETPQKTLHVNGDLQLTRELNVGGNSTTVGSPGNSGQVLVSQGVGLAPVWQTLDTNTNDGYKLKGVYRTTLTNAAISALQTSSPIGTVNDIKVNSTDNFIFIITQNLASTNSNSGFTTASSLNFEYIFNGTSYISPIEILQRQGFNDAIKGIAYSFSILNAPTGTFSLQARAWKRNTQGTSETIYFNRNASGTVIPGSLVVFVYEK